MDHHVHSHGLGKSAGTPEAIDPVCGMTVKADSPHRYTFEGKEYLFCCGGCRRRFISAPKDFLSKAPGSPGETARVPIAKIGRGRPNLPAHGVHARAGHAHHHAGATAQVAVGDIGRARTTGAPAPAGTTIYTCPMHPEIRRPGPGHCPICGMALEPEMPTLEEEKNPELIDFGRRFWWTLPLTIASVALAMGASRLIPLGMTTLSWLELAIATPVVLWAGWPFFVRCIDSIRNRSPNMWTLIGIGVASAYVYSALAAIAPSLFPDAFREGGR